ncbi:MAG: M67 family metallopeptidase [Planctomycetaceae bacterium]|jgi:proteasome lid subunit RPN8/RPN11|nr:M67 family metallopeptidase [Planctomycetaceae bacterium]
MIILTQQQIAEINRHAEAEYPNECCGAVLGQLEHGGKKTAHRIIPISNRREAEAKHNRFLILPNEFLQCEKTARQAGLEIIGFYHSHPDHPAEPSAYDLDQAWPVYSYVIVAVAEGCAGNMTSWELQNDRTRFREESIIKESDP